MSNYDHKDIEKKWQDIWQKNALYQVKDAEGNKENFYTLVEFAYPSGNLHVGHWYAFAVPDIFARFKRMQGYNVLYPTGFDAFGLPAENAAIKLGKDPKVWTYEHMEHMRGQLRSMGASFDWSREVVTCDPEYYRWTQWMFTQFLKNDLAYRATTKVNWCPKDKTILANEQVVDGACERCGEIVIQKDQEQWMLRITKFADALVDDLETLSWPTPIKEAQKNWIGRSEGSEINFKLKTTDKNLEEVITVFTTRADTLFGVTYVVIAPEHQLIQDLKKYILNLNEVEDYIAQTKNKSELDRQQLKEKSGVPLSGIFAINPANNEQVPVWIGDYVIATYGTGMVMAVPAHDERDFEFANKYKLPIKKVIARETGEKRENEEFKDGGAAVVFDPVSQKYAVAECKDGKILLFAGGVSENENVEEAVIREVLEEGGLYDFSHIEWIESSYAHYFNTLKKVNRFARAECFLCILKSTDTKSVTLEAHEDFTLSWKTAKEILDYWEGANSDDGLHHYIRFLKESVSRAISLGYDTTSDPTIFKSTAMTEYGVLENSGSYNGLYSDIAKHKITDEVGGKVMKTYRLRDWGISRQRYWGCPIPIVYDPKGIAHPVPDEHLPWILPKDVDHTPDGTPPLKRSKELFERTEAIFGKGWTPEVETMDTFVDSSWYFYRYLDPKNNSNFISKDAHEDWMPVSMYFGGAEHTTMHLLYARFWVKALNSIGLVSEKEPFSGRLNRGLILGPDGNKMSKSKGNVIDPDEIVKLLGADTVRLYLAFIGPYNVPGSYPWDPNGVVGVRRFLERVWKLKDKISQEYQSDQEKKKIQHLLHTTIKKVGEDIAEFKFNTAISAMMICSNLFSEVKNITKNDYEVLLQLLAPFAPHIAEELWNQLGNKDSIHLSLWPHYVAELLSLDTAKIVVQVNGKLRATFDLKKDSTQEEVFSFVSNKDEIKKYIEGDIKKVIFVPNKLINIVI